MGGEPINSTLGVATLRNGGMDIPLYPHVEFGGAPGPLGVTVLKPDPAGLSSTASEGRVAFEHLEIVRPPAPNTALYRLAFALGADPTVSALSQRFTVRPPSVRQCVISGTTDATKVTKNCDSECGKVHADARNASDLLDTSVSSLVGRWTLAKQDEQVALSAQLGGAVATKLTNGRASSELRFISTNPAKEDVRVHFFCDYSQRLVYSLSCKATNPSARIMLGLTHDGTNPTIGEFIRADAVLFRRDESHTPSWPGEAVGESLESKLLRLPRVARVSILSTGRSRLCGSTTDPDYVVFVTLASIAEFMPNAHHLPNLALVGSTPADTVVTLWSLFDTATINVDDETASSSTRSVLTEAPAPWNRSVTVRTDAVSLPGVQDFVVRLHQPAVARRVCGTFNVELDSAFISSNVNFLNEVSVDAGDMIEIGTDRYRVVGAPTAGDSNVLIRLDRAYTGITSSTQVVFARKQLARDYLSPRPLFMRLTGAIETTVSVQALPRLLEPGSSFYLEFARVRTPQAASRIRRSPDERFRRPLRALASLTRGRRSS